jgi:hypothetical protein
MMDILRQMIWFIIVAGAVAYASFLVAGSLVSAQAAGAASPIMVRDELGPGSHQLSGMIMVPSSCDELSVRAETVSSSTYSLLFQTWQDPAVNCSSDEVPRAFHAVLFAPAAGVDFTATLDGKDIPILVLPSVHGK